MLWVQLHFVRSEVVHSTQVQMFTLLQTKVNQHAFGLNKLLSLVLSLLKFDCGWRIL